MVQPIRIGEINTYSPSAISGFMATYKNGIVLTVEVLYRDNKLKTAVAARFARQLLLQDKVDLIAGTFTSDAASLRPSSPTS